MKQCLACNRLVERRKKGKCPHCDTPVFYDTKGRIRPESDKDLATGLLLVIEMWIENRDKVSVELNKEPRQRNVAYAYIDKARKFIAGQAPLYRDIDRDSFTRDVLVSILQDAYWGKHIVSMVQANSVFTEHAIKVFKVHKNKVDTKLAQMSLKVDYTLYQGLGYGADRL